MNDITKSDWTIFKKKLAVWQNNHMQHLLDEYSQIINGKGEPVDKFWKLEKRIYLDKRHKGVICDLRRSAVLDNLLSLLFERVITTDDLKDFSEELQNRVLAYYNAHI